MQTVAQSACNWASIAIYVQVGVASDGSDRKGDVEKRRLDRKAKVSELALTELARDGHTALQRNGRVGREREQRIIGQLAAGDADALNAHV